ncbi:hypothetical protein JCM10207_003648 [Rhodosporidiobolus poonsookiae]
MDALKALIDTKKRSLDLPSSSSSSAQQPPPKYLKRSELERIRQEEHDREQRIKEQQRKQKLYGSKPSSSSSTSTPANASPAPPGADSPATGTPEPSASTSAAAVEERFNVSNDEAVRRLRQKGQPIRLFGESDKDRRLRLRALELLEREQASSGAVGGQRNEFQRAVRGQEIQAELDEVARRGGTPGGGGGGTPGSRPGTPAGGAAADRKGKGRAKEGTPLSADGAATDSDAVDEAASAGAVAKKAGEDGEGKVKEPNPKDEDVLVDLELVRTNPHKIYPQIYHAFKRVLKEWEQSLADRPEAIRRSTQGKVAAATQATSAEYLKPLFKQLRKRDLPKDVLPNLAEIAHYMQTREYLRANDAYLRLSIGNAPWPIGVTMVGIHERSGREKIFSNNVAHVLNDETSRKYIQSLKRLLTFAQAVRPPDDVSQK